MSIHYIAKDLEEKFNSSNSSLLMEGHEWAVADIALGQPEKGLYVDIGAYDPIDGSQTVYFFNKGWHGINIEPQTERFQKFCGIRTNDINLNIAISGEEKEAIFYILSNDAASSLSFEHTKKENAVHNHNITRTVNVSCMPLRKVFRDYRIQEKIDFMNVDVEGMELDVLQSNNWDDYRPSVILIETYHAGEKVLRDYMNSIGYRLLLQNDWNAIFENMKR